MVGNDLERFTNAFRLCWATLANNKPEQPLLYKVYYDSLINFSIEQVESSFSKATTGLKWYPKPVERIELITGSDECNGDVQATNVLKAISQVGGYTSVNFNDPVTHAVIDRVYGGWVKLCQEQLEKDNQWFLKDFSKYYKSFKTKGVEKYGHLGGRIESQNSEIGIKHDDVKQIGEVLKQIEVKNV